MTSVSVVIKPEYGYVLLVYLTSVLINFWMSSRVYSARKQYKVEYPAEYLVELKDNKVNQNNVFNCLQRAHQNFLENYFMVMALLFIAGLKFPVYSAASGAVWLTGRVLYAIGYGSGVPSRRSWGGVQYLGTLSLLGMSIATGLSFLKLVDVTPYEF